MLNLLTNCSVFTCGALKVKNSNLCESKVLNDILVDGGFGAILRDEAAVPSPECCTLGVKIRPL